MSGEGELREPASALNGQTSDIEILPRLVRLLAEQMRTSFDLLNIEIRNGFARIEKRLDSQADDIAELRSNHNTLATQHNTLAKRVDELEKPKPPQPRTRAKRSTPKKKR